MIKRLALALCLISSVAQAQIITSGGGAGGGGGTPGGISGQIQYNSAGTFGGTATGTGVLTAIGNNVSGSGSIALTVSPAFITPALDTPSAIILSNGTGLPISTGVSGLGAGVAAAHALGLNGSGALVGSISPAFTTPNLGTPSAAVLISATGLPLTTGVSGILPSANGGTGVANSANITLGGALTTAGALTTTGAFSTALTVTAATALTLPTSGTVTAQGNAVTGSGSIVLATSPALVTPALGTPSAAVLTNATGLPVATGVSGLGTGVATALGSVLNGTGALVATTSPALVTPNLGTPSAAVLTSATGLPLTTGVTGVLPNANTNIGTSGATIPLNNGANTWSATQTHSAPIVNSTAGAASTPPVALTGALFTGGTGTTTKPQLLVEPTGTPSTAWNTGGTALGLNVPAGFGGLAIDIQKNGASQFRVDGSGVLVAGGNITTGGGLIASGNIIGNTNGTGIYLGNANDTILTRRAAANWQLGLVDAAAPVAQTLTAQSVIAGTTNTAGPNFTVQSPAGTGLGIGGSHVWQVAPAGITGTAQNAWSTAMTLDANKNLTVNGAIGTTFAAFNIGGDTFLSKRTGANFQLGNGDSGSPVAQTLTAQSVAAGNSNIAGTNLTIQGSASTGSAKSGDVILQAGGTGVAATTQNSFVTGLTILGGAGAGVIKHPTFTVAALPSCAVVGAGGEAFVTDATAPTYNTALVGGGAVGIPAFCDGTAWKSH